MGILGGMRDYMVEDFCVGLGGGQPWYNEELGVLMWSQKIEV